MTGFDINQAQRHIELLRGDANAAVHWKFFTDDAANKKLAPASFFSTLNESITSIHHYQKLGYGVFIVVNPTDGEGGAAINVVDYNWLLVDIDGAELPKELPLDPLFVTSRDDTHFHLYFPVSGCLTTRQYNYVQRKLAIWFNADTQVIDPSRVLRLAGTLNMKNPASPVMYNIITDNSSTIDYEYDIDEVIDAFSLSEEEEAKLESWVGSRESIDIGSGFNDVPLYRMQLVKFAQELAPIAVKGNNRSFELIKVAGYGYDRGVRLEETQDILWNHYNQRCDPPWTEAEKNNFYKYIKNGYRYYSNAAGCKTASGSFSNRQVPEPIGGWEENQKLGNKSSNSSKSEPAIAYEPSNSDDDLGYVDQEYVDVMSAKLDSKSKPFDLARFFLGMCYPRKMLIVNDSVFYAYNGKHWEEVTRDYLAHQVHHLYAALKLKPADVKNIIDTVAAFVLVRKLEKGHYISTGKPSSAVVMNNGIVNITDDGQIELKPHSQDLFELNILGYNYDPSAKCDEFLRFIDAQWTNDIEMHNQMQEFYGLTLINDKRFQVFPLLIGKSRSGKGTHISIIRKMIGDHNICGPSLEGLLTHSTIHDMSSKKLALIPEANDVHQSVKGRVLDRLKSITGGDPIQYDRKYESAATCSNWPLIIASANEMPSFVDGSGALANRIWAFPFMRSFYGNEDRELSGRLTSDESISGILNWALIGAVRVMKSGKLTMSVQSKEFVDEVKHDTFLLSDFVEEFCIINGESSVLVADLYEHYLLFCRAKGIKLPMTQIKFAKCLKSSWLPVNKVRSKTGSRPNMFTGIGINTEVSTQYKPSFSAVIPFDKNKKVTEHEKKINEIQKS